MLVGRSLNKSCEFVTLLTFKDTDLTSVMVGSNAAKTNVNLPADKKSSKLGNWSSKKKCYNNEDADNRNASFFKAIECKDEKK